MQLGSMEGADEGGYATFSPACAVSRTYSACFQSVGSPLPFPSSLTTLASSCSVPRPGRYDNRRIERADPDWRPVDPRRPCR
jgi:hypothetical protein